MKKKKIKYLDCLFPKNNSIQDVVRKYVHFNNIKICHGFCHGFLVVLQNRTCESGKRPAYYRTH